MSRIKVIDKTKVEQPFRIIMSGDAIAPHHYQLRHKVKKQQIRAWIVPRCCIDEVLIKAIRSERIK